MLGQVREQVREPCAAFAVLLPAAVLGDEELAHAALGTGLDALEEGGRYILAGEAESDDFNRLVLAVGLTWREVAVLRAYAKYLRQTGFTFSQAYMEQTLAAHPALARQLLELFIARFDPDLGEDRAEHVANLAAALQADLDEVANLDEDRIMRQFLAVIQASLRTNWFRRDGGAPRPCLSFKLDPHAIPGLPEPRPLQERRKAKPVAPAPVGDELAPMPED